MYNFHDAYEAWMQEQDSAYDAWLDHLAEADHEESIPFGVIDFGIYVPVQVEEIPY